MRLWPFLTRRQILEAVAEEKENRRIGPPYQDDPWGGPTFATVVAREILDEGEQKQ